MSPFALGPITCQVCHLVDSAKLCDDELWLDICDANKIALPPSLHCMFDGRNVRDHGNLKGNVGSGIGAIAFQYVGTQDKAPFLAMGMLFQWITVRIFCRCEQHVSDIGECLRQDEQHAAVMEGGYYSFITNAIAVPTGPVTCLKPVSRLRDQETRELIARQWPEHKSESFLKVFKTCMDKSWDIKREAWAGTTPSQRKGTKVRVFEGPAAEGGGGSGGIF